MTHSSPVSANDLDPGTIARNLRGLASRMQYRVEAIENRDGKGAGAVTGPGVGIGYLLAKDLAEALGEAATFIEGVSTPAQPSDNDFLAEYHMSPDEMAALMRHWQGRAREAEASLASLAQPQTVAQAVSEFDVMLVTGRLRALGALKEDYGQTQHGWVREALHSLSRPDAPQTAPDTISIPVNKFRACECPMDHTDTVGGCLDKDMCHCLVMEISTLALSRQQRPESYCKLCDKEHPVHEDAQGFHHVVKGERVACPLPSQEQKT